MAFQQGNIAEAIAASPTEYRARWAAVTERRTALRAEERAYLTETGEYMLSNGELERAATAISAGVTLDAGSFSGLEQSLMTAVAEADAAVAANAWVAMSEAHHLDVGFHQRAQREARNRLDQGLVQQRYQHKVQPQTIAGFSGVHAGMLKPLIARVEQDYRVTPPWQAMGAAAAARLGWLSSHPDVLQAVPGVRDFAETCRRAEPVDDRVGLEAQAAALVDAGVKAGLPESVVVGEWSEGAIGALDPWSSAIWPAALTGWEVHHSGIEVGVGLTLEQFGEQVVVTLPDPRGPAWEAGVHQGDVVSQLDGASVSSWPVDERLARAQAALRGEEGSSASLLVQRDEQERRFVVERRAVQEETVFALETTADNTPNLWLQPDLQIAYLRISAFRPFTDEVVARFLTEHAAGATAVVVDLRSNGGGDVQAAVNVADLFASEGKAGDLAGRNLPSEERAIDEDGQPMAMWNEMIPGDPWEGLPLAVLVDADTASAAELLASALRDEADAWVLGEQTLGKGWSQGLLMDETHGFALQLTNAEWRTSRGHPVHREPGAQRWGVEPSIAWRASEAESWQRRHRQKQAVHPRTHADGTPMFVAPMQSPLPLLDEDPLLLIAEVALWSRVAR